MDLDGKLALVTGGTSGIGRATSEALAAAGARVLVTGRGERAMSEFTPLARKRLAGAKQAVDNLWTPAATAA